MSTLTAKRFTVTDLDSAVQLCYERKWTDGLPVVPATEAAVTKIIDYLRMDPKHVIGIVPPRRGIATVEKVAINCVMAGCLPEHVPIVIAALEAIMEPEFNLEGVQTTTNPCVPVVMVSGPIARSFNTKDCALGHGSRTNGAIGRAVRLILWNIGGGYPGEPCRTTLGHPGYWSFCIAEDEETRPWPALHVDRGFAPEDNVVTVTAVDGPHATNTGALHNSADEVLTILADGIARLGSNNMLGGSMVLVLGPMAAKRLAEAGYSRGSLTEELVQRASRPARELRRNRFIDHMLPATRARLDRLRDDEPFQYFTDPGAILIIVTGSWGAIGSYAAVCPGWGHFGGHTVSRKITFPN